MLKKLLCSLEAMKKVQCQSCGMPLDKDPEHGDTEKDGTHSNRWCSFCYANGEFTRKDCALEDMKIIVSDAMKKDNMNWAIQKMAMLQLPHLERWKIQR